MLLPRMKIRINKRLKISIISILIILSVLFGFVINRTVKYDKSLLVPYEKKVSSEKTTLGDLNMTGTDMTISENNRLIMKMNTEDFSIQLIDKINQFVWSTASSEEYHQVAIKNKLLRRGLRQLFQMNIVNMNNETEIANNIVAEHTVKAFIIENGVKLKYYFTDYKIGLEIDFYLDEYSFHVMIPSVKIIEEGEYRIASIDMLPFLGAVRTDEKGYFVFPDGCGAKYNFGGAKEFKSSPFIRDVYSQSTYELDLLNEEKMNEIKNILIPAFGIVREKNAMVGYILEGDISSSLRIAPAGNIYQLDRIYSSAIYRKTYKMVMPDKKESIEVEKNKRLKDYHLQYCFVYQENGASYGDLAKEVRKILQKQNQLPKQTTKATKPVISIQFLMGAIEKTLLYDSYKSMTTYSEALQILNELKSTTLIDYSTILFGWQKKGYGIVPTDNNPALAIGGEKKEREFFNGLKNLDIKGYENINPVFVRNGSTGYSKMNDLANDAAGIPITNTEQNEFLIRPLKVFYDFQNKWSKRFESNMVNGIAFDSIGSILYDDYDKNSDMTRQDTATTWSALTTMAKDRIGNVAVQGGNAYLLANADFLYDIPDQHSNYSIYQEAIPFYQMIMHGYIPYTSQTSGNLAYDYDYQKLKWIEFGSIPSFVLTKEKTDKLINTAANKLFTSEYSKYQDSIIKLANEYKNNFEGIQGSEILFHDRKDDIVTVKYSNGKTIIINYSDMEIIIDGQKISAKNYAVKEEPISD